MEIHYSSTVQVVLCYFLVQEIFTSGSIDLFYFFVFSFIFEIFQLVVMFAKLFNKLASRVLETRVPFQNSNCMWKKIHVDYRLGGGDVVAIFGFDCVCLLIFVVSCGCCVSLGLDFWFVWFLCVCVFLGEFLCLLIDDG